MRRTELIDRLIESNKVDTIDFNPHGGELDSQFYIN